MSYQEARAQVVSIIRGITPTENGAFGSSTKFSHAPEGDDGDNLRSRSFWIESNVDGEGGLAMPFTPDIAGQPRVVARVTLVVTYRQHEGKRAMYDENLEMDADDIARALLTPSQWGSRSTTKLDYIDDFSWQRSKIEDGRVEQRFTFAMHYIS